MFRSPFCINLICHENYLENQATLSVETVENQATLSVETVENQATLSAETAVMSVN